jgi:hypothetical protein
MKRLFAVVAFACSLHACSKPADSAIAGPKKDGRYVGVGIYGPGALWPYLKNGPSEKNADAATLADDDEIIVVVDTHSGELRQCGNLSGHCIRMNPWGEGKTPVTLSKHRSDLMDEQDTATAANVTAPATK